MASVVGKMTKNWGKRRKMKKFGKIFENTDQIFFGGNRFASYVIKGIYLKVRRLQKIKPIKNDVV